MSIVGDRRSRSKDHAMLITFRSKAAASITMFGEPAVALLKMMGQSGVAPGAIQGADVAAALARLKAAVGKAPAPAMSSQDEDSRGEPAIGLAKRALPLIDLLEKSVAAKADVVWESG
jgi:hypothetical protein